MIISGSQVETFSDDFSKGELTENNNAADITLKNFKITSVDEKHLITSLIGCNIEMT